MRVIWTPEAEKDRGEVWNYIVADDAQAAVFIDELFSNAAKRLADFPMLGHEGRIKGTREFLIHENYRFVYEIDGQTIWLLALVHSARQWPPVRK